MLGVEYDYSQGLPTPISGLGQGWGPLPGSPGYDMTGKPIYQNTPAPTTPPDASIKAPAPQPAPAPAPPPLTLSDVVPHLIAYGFLGYLAYLVFFKGKGNRPSPAAKLGGTLVEISGGLGNTLMVISGLGAVAKYSAKAKRYISKKIPGLIHDEGMKPRQAVATAINMARAKGYRVPKRKKARR
jgi:hypothetical protein